MANINLLNTSWRAAVGVIGWDGKDDSREGETKWRRRGGGGGAKDEEEVKESFSGKRLAMEGEEDEKEGSVKWKGTEENDGKGGDAKLF